MAMPDPESFEEEAPVIDAIRSGDRYAFAEFLRRHDLWVRGVIFGALGHRDGLDDVTQHVWSAFWQRISELRDTGKWKPWLYRLARNAAVDAGRERSRRRGLAGAAAQPSPAHGSPAPPDQFMVRDEQQTAVLSAILGLPALYREPFVLRHLNGWSYRNIAEAMNLPVDTVETRLVRARRLLRESLQDRIR